MGLTAVPPVESFANGTPMEKVLEALYRDGAVRIKGLLSPSEIDEINGEIQPYLDADFNSGLNVFAKQTKTVCGLAGKSPAAVRNILQHPTVKAAVNDALTITTNSWWGDSRNACTSPPLLSSFFTVRVGPGSARQGLHRDDQDHHATHAHGDPRETTKLGCIVATSKTTRANGATEIVPGSHVWDDERKPKMEECTYAEMDPGDCVFVMGNCYHAAGGNTTADEFRSVIVALFCKGVCRAEENQFLAVSREQVAKYDPEVQDLLGWRASAPFCGWTDFRHPYDLIRTEGATQRDLF
jgi:hypothetical protein